MCVIVLPFRDSSTGHHTDMRPVSLEPVGHGGGHRIKKIFEKWPVAKLPIKKVRPSKLFKGKILL